MHGARGTLFGQFCERIDDGHMGHVFSGGAVRGRNVL